MDRGANGGLSGPDMRTMSESSHVVDITGISGTELSDIKLSLVQVLFKQQMVLLLHGSIIMQIMARDLLFMLKTSLKHLDYMLMTA